MKMGIQSYSEGYTPTTLDDGKSRQDISGISTNHDVMADNYSVGPLYTDRALAKPNCLYLSNISPVHYL